jgi:hypothetical protein
MQTDDSVEKSPPTSRLRSKQSNNTAWGFPWCLLYVFLSWLILKHRRWKQHVPSKCWLNFNGPHRFIPEDRTALTKKRRGRRLCNYSRTSQHFMEPKVHYHLHKNLSLVFILSQINQCIPPHPASPRSILILSTHLRLYLPSYRFPSNNLFSL